MTPCFISLGSNLQQPLGQVQRACAALAELPDSQLQKISPWYRSRAIGPGQQDDYINGVAQLDTGLAPLELLHALQAIETRQLRVRNQRWGPRTLDLDLLLYGQQVIDSQELCVPHPRMTERNFVLYPLADLAPGLVFPDGTSLASLLDYCPRDGLILADTKTAVESQLDQPGKL
jgi:2-amino-4-hydroxy-6-hydroxymethyldihydropteridine diphosphokinase